MTAENAWNLDWYLTKEIVSGLRQLATDSNCYPVDKFISFEEWQRFLLDLAAKFEAAFARTSGPSEARIECFADLLWIWDNLWW